MAEQRIPIQGNLGVNSNHAVIGCFQHRIDLEHGGITADVGIVQSGDELRHLLERLATQPEVEGHATRLKSLQPHCRVNLFFENQFRRFFRHGFNVHAALRAVHDDVASGSAIEQNAHVDFLRLTFAWGVDVLGNQHLIHLLPASVCLRCDQMASENACRFVLDFVKPLGQNNTMGPRLGHGSLATTARMNLRLHNKPLCPSGLCQFHRCLMCCFRRLGDTSFLDGHAEAFQNRLALVFVDVHGFAVFFAPRS